MADSQQSLIPQDPKSDLPPIIIHVVEGTVWCSPNGGALRALQRTKVHWECAYPFTLTFTQLGGTEQPWGPFTSHRSDGKEVVDSHTQSVAPDAQAPFYKYTVRVGKLMLDPIIIIDKP
jgi:hypothetical protein